jgi:hypothetical protein
VKGPTRYTIPNPRAAGGVDLFCYWPCGWMIFWVRGKRSPSTASGERIPGGRVATVPPAGTGQVQHPEQAADHDVAAVFASPWSTAMRAGRLFGQCLGDLGVDHRVWHRFPRILGLDQLQPRYLVGQRFALDREHPRTTGAVPSSVCSTTCTLSFMPHPSMRRHASRVPSFSSAFNS